MSLSGYMRWYMHTKGQGVALCTCVNFNSQPDKCFLVSFHIYEGASLITCVRVTMVRCVGARRGIWTDVNLVKIFLEVTHRVWIGERVDVTARFCPRSGVGTGLPAFS